MFNALTRAGADVANYPFCTIDPNVGVIAVPDARLPALNAVEQRSRAVPAVIEFIDIAGLVEGASRGEGRGNQFLEHIHHADALVHVVRCFRDPNVAHVRADLSPVDDVRTINLELILADLQTAQNACEKLGKRARGNDREARAALEVMQTLRDHLDEEQPARTAPLSADAWERIREYRFLTRKPVIYVANLGEDDLPDMDSEMVRRLEEIAGAEGNIVIPICARIESEIAELDEGEAEEFLEAMGLTEPSLDRLLRECYAHLGLITFFTVGDEEVRAWTIPRGFTAPEAGGVIHTDFKESFIRVEVTHFPDFEEFGSRQEAKAHGRMHVEGKDYVVRDGDILYFRV